MPIRFPVTVNFRSLNQGLVLWSQGNLFLSPQDRDTEKDQTETHCHGCPCDSVSEVEMTVVVTGVILTAPFPDEPSGRPRLPGVPSVWRHGGQSKSIGVGTCRMASEFQ